MSGLLKRESSSGLRPPWRAPSASLAWLGLGLGFLRAQASLACTLRELGLFGTVSKFVSSRE